MIRRQLRILRGIQLPRQHFRLFIHRRFVSFLRFSCALIAAQDRFKEKRQDSLIFPGFPRDGKMLPYALQFQKRQLSLFARLFSLLSF